MGNFEKDFRLFANDNGISNTSIDKYSKFLNGIIEPTIIEERNRYATQISVFSRLFIERILFLGTEIDSDVANIINSQLLYLEMENPKSQITLYINSPGGSVFDGLSIYDTMNYITCPVATTCMGMAASMGAVLLMAGEKGKRYALPNSQIMIHEPMSGIAPRTKASDFEVEAEQMRKCKNNLMTIMGENCGKTAEEMIELCKHDKWFTAEEAVKENLIDSVIKRKK